MFFSLFLWIVLFLTAQSVESHEQNFQCLIRATRNLIHLQNDSAVELEIKFDSNSIHLFTTEDGTLRPLFSGGIQPPLWLARYRVRAGKTMDADIPWDMLSPESKIKLIREISAQRDPSSFWDDRRIPGLKTLPELGLNQFVEFVSPLDIRHLNGIELHYRGPESASIAAQNALFILKKKGIHDPNRHIHMTAPVRLFSTQTEAEREAAKKVNFFARAELFAQLEAVMHRKIPVTESLIAGIVRIFGPLHSDQFARTYLKWRSGLIKGQVDLGNSFRGFFGMRGTDKYDQPGLWGMEYRAAGRPKSVKEEIRLGELLDGVQTTMLDPNYGLDEGRIDQWLAKIAEKPEVSALISDRDSKAKSIELSIYDYNIEVWKKNGGWTHSSPVIAELLSRPELISKILKAGEKNYLVYALVHDWSFDPLFFDKPEILNRIVAAQKKALSRILYEKNPGPAIDQLIIFFRGSGIYNELAQSLNLRTFNP